MGILIFLATEFQDLKTKILQYPLIFNFFLIFPYFTIKLFFCNFFNIKNFSTKNLINDISKIRSKTSHQKRKQKSIPPPSQRSYPKASTSKTIFSLYFHRRPHSCNSQQTQNISITKTNSLSPKQALHILQPPLRSQKQLNKPHEALYPFSTRIRLYARQSRHSFFCGC